MCTFVNKQASQTSMSGKIVLQVDSVKGCANASLNKRNWKECIMSQMDYIALSGWNTCMFLGFLG